jgi:hypothetical protein
VAQDGQNWLPKRTYQERLFRYVKYRIAIVGCEKWQKAAPLDSMHETQQIPWSAIRLAALAVLRHDQANKDANTIKMASANGQG